MDLLQEIQTTNVNDYEYEDDVFYNELRKRVLQLTEEDDEEWVFGSRNSDMAVAQKQRGYYNWPPNKDGIAAPASIMNLWRTGNGTGTGTGVFIPQIVQESKKKNRSRRKRNERGRTYNRVERN